MLRRMFVWCRTMLFARVAARGCKWLVAALLLGTGAPCLAQANFEEVPTNWRLQNYIGDNITVYYTPSPCTDGWIAFPASASTDDKNRFWSLVMTAKATARKVGVFYDPANCNILSFYEGNP